MNNGPTAARAFIAAFPARWAPRDDRSVIFFPPALSLRRRRQRLGSRADLGVGVQNIWTEDKGAFTGENSAPMAKDAGARFALVGHSERRHVFGETEAETALKCAAAVRAGLTPVLCVGEMLESTRSGHNEPSCVDAACALDCRTLTPDVISSMAIAYEPVWAIGTGRTATPNDAAMVHAVIRTALRERVGERARRASDSLRRKRECRSNASRTSRRAGCRRITRRRGEP